MLAYFHVKRPLDEKKKILLVLTFTCLDNFAKTDPAEQIEN